ncbi:T9SS type A sorting domain-containing protein [Flavobacterium sp.]|uniref:T9SS type A sorting domain-containing protein n=1 Tax=Flavobacterium sp. TaxID=239 RepID=UPI00286EA194|nr:T9SS type A sorting domain-containing protein [Flavobacterium sp.]
MKKNTFYKVVFVLIAFTFSSQAQVLNSGFETIKPNGKISNWGIDFVHPVSIDINTGAITQDFIQFDNYDSFAISSAPVFYTGDKSLEIRNAYNYTKDKVIPGGAELFFDATQDTPGWNSGVPITNGNLVNVLGFYYFFTPINNFDGLFDVVEATLTVFGENGEIGKATIKIAEPNYIYSGLIEFNYIETPVVYTTNEAPVFMTLKFNMAAQGSTPHYGTRIIIDDVKVFNPLLTVKDNSFSSFNIYPTLVDNHIVITNNNQNNSFDFSIVNMQGQIVKKINERGQKIEIDVSLLASGMYFIKSENSELPHTTKFIKK